MVRPSQNSVALFSRCCSPAWPPRHDAAKMGTSRAQVMRVYPPARQRSVPVLVRFNMSWCRAPFQVLALDHPERVVRRGLDLAHSDIDRHDWSFVDRIMTAL